VRALFLTFAAIGLLATSAAAQTAQTDIDISTFIKSATQGWTVIQDPEAPVSFQLAPGWNLDRGIRWGDHETTLWFGQAGSRITVALYYQSPLAQPYPQNAAAFLRQGMDAKVAQRQGEGFADYHVRPDSIQTLQVGGQPALSFIAEFNNGRQARAEYMLRVLGKSTKAHFFVMGIPAEDIAAFVKSFDPIAETLRIP
jgi:hypothetical protein